MAPVVSAADNEAAAGGGKAGEARGEENIPGRIATLETDRGKFLANSTIFGEIKGWFGLLEASQCWNDDFRMPKILIEKLEYLMQGEAETKKNIANCNF